MQMSLPANLWCRQVYFIIQLQHMIHLMKEEYQLA